MNVDVFRMQYSRFSYWIGRYPDTPMLQTVVVYTVREREATSRSIGPQIDHPTISLTQSGNQDHSLFTERESFDMRTHS
jgi:hypothetical protein